jgi:hypothetical protein
MLRAARSCRKMYWAAACVPSRTNTCEQLCVCRRRVRVSVCGLRRQPLTAAPTPNTHLCAAALVREALPHREGHEDCLRVARDADRHCRRHRPPRRHVQALHVHVGAVSVAAVHVDHGAVALCRVGLDALDAVHDDKGGAVRAERDLDGAVVMYCGRVCLCAMLSPPDHSSAAHQLASPHI